MMEPIRVTESAALTAGQRVGHDQKEKGDGAAVDAMHQLINTVAMNSVAITSEGEKDETPVLFNGEKVGNGQGPTVDIAVSPIDGTTLTAEGRPNSITVLITADLGPMYDPPVVFYIDKIAAGPEAAGKIDIEVPVEHNIKVVAKARGLRPEDVTAVVLDCPRHADMIRDIRKTGAKIRLIGNGDVAGAVAAVQNASSVGIMIGAGSTPESVITACATKCMGDEIQGKLHPRDEVEIKRTFDAGYDLPCIPTTDDLAAPDNHYFTITGVTSNDILCGVAYRGNDAWIRSLVMRSRSGTIRRTEALHFLEKLCKYASIDYGKGETPDTDL